MSASALRAHNPPTRRLLASTLAEAIPVINTQAGNIQYLKSQADARETDVAKLREALALVEDAQRFLTLTVDGLQAVRQRSLWGRLTWLVRGQ